MSRLFLVLLISVLVTLGPFTNNIVIPSLPGISAEFGASYGAAQLVLSVYLAAFAAAQLFVGPLSDRFGRKPVLIGSLAGFVFTSALGAAATSLEMLIAIRLVQALAISATMSVGRAMVRDLFSSDRIAQVYAYVGTALAIGPTLGPVFGGLLEESLGWRSVFLFTVGVGVAMLAIVLACLGETNLHRNPHAMNPRQMFGNYLRLLGTRKYVGYVSCNTFCYGGVFCYTSGSAYVLIDLLHVTPLTFGILYAITVGCYGIGTLTASQFTRRLGVDRMILTGGAIMTVAGTAMLVLPLIGIFEVWSVVVPFGGFTLGTGFVFPSGQAGAITPYPRMAGAASSMLSFLQMSSAAIAGSVSARFLDGSVLPMAIPIFAMGPLMLATFSLMVLRAPPEPPEGEPV